MDKVPSGIAGFDELLFGGILRGNSVLVEGVPGAGKTTFGIEFIYRGITEYHEPGVIITFEQLPRSIYRDALNFGWDLMALEKENKLRIVCTSPEILLDTETNLVEEVVREIGARRILVDSITHFRHVVSDPMTLRGAIYSFCNGLKRLDLTALLVKERETVEGTGYPFEEYVVETVIRLENKERPALHRHRVLEITKTRGQEHVPGKHTFRITGEGIKIFALCGLADLKKQSGRPNELLPTGITGLDELLRGGLPPGMTVLVAGDSGTGKTILGLQYLVTGALNGNQKGVFLSLEETPSHLMANARCFNWDLQVLDGQDLVKVVYRPMTETEIDETIISLGRLVQRLKARRVVIDSLFGLLSRIDNLAVLREKFFYLVSYLNSLNCTTLLLYPFHEIQTDVRFEVIQSMAQGTILLKSTLLQNHRVRQLELYKMRGINHIMGKHLMEISSDFGVQVFPRTGGKGYAG